MNVIMISPGFPVEMPLFTRALAQVGARVLGVGDQPKSALSDETRQSLSAYLQVRDLWDEEAMVREVGDWARGHTIDRIECLWEPGMVLAARLREALGVPGLDVAQTIPFRDKEIMKQVLDERGLRTPRHARCSTQEECREAAERIGYPLIIKPIAGAGSADTYPLWEESDLEDALKVMGHVVEVSVEEYVEGEEFTFDTVCANGQILFENVGWYRPKPLITRLNPSIAGQAIVIRNIDAPEFVIGRELGRGVLDALGFETGFTHMEWFHTPAGEAVFGEIAARPPGGRFVHVMNYSADIDLFVGWAEAVCYGSLSQDTTKQYNAAISFNRSQGSGATISAIEGLEPLLSSWGEHVAAIDLPQIGRPRQDWRKLISGDGWVVVRHPELQTTLQMADEFSAHLRILAE